MNQLIPIADRQIGNQPVQTVDARELHEFLEVGKVFAAWIQERIEQYGFVEHRDFEVFSESGKNPLGGRPTIQYAISLDMAKELAMVERSKKGKQARQYFIECERALRSQPVALLTPIKRTVESAKMVPPMVRAAMAFGLDRSAAAISTNQAVARLTGTNLLALLGHTHLESSKQELFFTSTQLGKRLDASARTFNMWLAEAGLQVSKGGTWVPLPAAAGLYRVFDTGKAHGDGTPIQQVKWSERVLDRVRQSLSQASMGTVEPDLDQAPISELLGIDIPPSEQ